MHLPICCKNLLRIFSGRVLFERMKFDKSPPLQYSMIRYMYWSSHCKLNCTLKRKQKPSFLRWLSQYSMQVVIKMEKVIFMVLLCYYFLFKFSTWKSSSLTMFSWFNFLRSSISVNRFSVDALFKELFKTHLMATTCLLPLWNIY